MSIDRLHRKLNERIDAEYNSRCTGLAATAGLDPTKDNFARGYIGAIREFKAWIGDAIREADQPSQAASHQEEGADDE